MERVLGTRHARRPRGAAAWRHAGGICAVILLLLLAAGCQAKQETRPFPTAADGVLDLRGWEWADRGPVPLSGTWKFTAGGGGPETTLDVPGMWGSKPTGDGREVPALGYGTYRLDIVREANSPLMAVRLPNISTAYRLWIDGHPALSRGEPGVDAAHTVPYQLPATVYLPAGGERVELRLEVSNFHHRSGGIRTELIIGLADQIDARRSRSDAQELIVSGCLIMMGLYHLGLFAMRRKELANLYFAMLCLFVTLRAGVIGEGFLVRWLPVFDWEGAMRTEYLSLLLSAWAGLAYYQRMYPGEIRRGWVKTFGAIGMPLAILALTVPTLRFTSWLPAYQLYLLAASITLFTALVVSTYRGRAGGRLALIGVAGLVAATINDMLFYNGWWRSTDLVPFGLLFLIFMNSLIIALRSSKTFERAEQLSAELKQWNDRLEGRIAERTEELRKSYATLEVAKTGLERMEASRRHLISNISHDLRTPITLLQGYLEALRDGVISEAEQRDSTIRLMLGKVEGLNALIHDLFELSVLEARRVELAFEPISLREWRDRVAEQYTRDMNERGIAFACEAADEVDHDRPAKADVQQMDRVFANLLFNAVRYTPAGGQIAVVFRRSADRCAVEITVEDTGSGIHPDDLPYIFDRFYKKDKSRHSSSGGSGLGLAISREIVELHGGKIEASNRPEGGCAFRITLPIPAEA